MPYTTAQLAALVKARVTAKRAVSGDAPYKHDVDKLILLSSVLDGVLAISSGLPDDGILLDSSGVVPSVDWYNRQLKKLNDSDNVVKTLDWSACSLHDVNEVEVLNWATYANVKVAGAASRPNLGLTGTVFTGGTGTTTLPAFLIQPTGTTAATNWSTSGTVHGINAPSGFAGNLADFKVNGSSVFKITSSGSVAIAADILADGAGFIAAASGNIIGAFNQYNLRMAPSIGVIWGSTAYGAVVDSGLCRDGVKTVGVMATSTLTSAGGVYGNLKACYLLPGATLATNMTEGFFNLPGAAGVPSGTPTITTGFPAYWDSTNLQLCIYTGGAWKKSAAFT